jgi:hypothetical protein
VFPFDEFAGENFACETNRYLLQEPIATRGRNLGFAWDCDLWCAKIPSSGFQPMSHCDRLTSEASVSSYWMSLISKAFRSFRLFTTICLFPRRGFAATLLGLRATLVPRGKPLLFVSVWNF